MRQRSGTSSRPHRQTPASKRSVPRRPSKGVLLAYGNYAGDIMNFGIAAERAAAEGIEVRTVLVTDDVASAPNTEIDRRRGIAGDVVVFKCAGAMAESGATLDDVERVARAANAATRSMGIALSAVRGARIRTALVRPRRR